MMNIFFSFCDVPEEWQIGFQDPATPLAEGMIAFHNSLMFYCVLVGFFVFTILTITLVFFHKENNLKPEKFTHSSELEIIWTIIPAVILLFIAVPSFALLYSLDDERVPFISLKIIGHQWYWSYEMDVRADMGRGMEMTSFESFDSYILKTSELRADGEFRLLEVDRRILLSEGNRTRITVTSADVLHSWAVPSFGIKVDACPGRLSRTSFVPKREGIFYGQCSEICGINHGFMPITIRVSSPFVFGLWLSVSDIASIEPLGRLSR
jgi:cytochrome c oxidase subunit 2